MFSIQCFVLPLILCLQLTVATVPVNESNWIDQDWENHMLEIENSIHLLSVSMVITSKIDRPVVPNLFSNQVNYIKYPDSMRATLLQISNDAYKSFLSVHSAVNQIHLYMQQVPQHVSKISFHQLAHSSTKQLNQIGERCTKLMEESTQSFHDLRNLLNEILQSENIVNATIAAPVKSKKSRKGNARKRIRKPIKTMVNATTSCDTITQNITDYYGHVSMASKSLLSVSKRFLDGGFPLPKLLEVITRLNNFTNMVNDVSNGSLQEFTNKTQDLLDESYSIFTLSKTYFKISQTFIMPRLAGLPKMLISITDEDRKLALKELCINQTSIHDGIKGVIKDGRGKKIGMNVRPGRTQ